MMMTNTDDEEVEEEEGELPQPHLQPHYAPHDDDDHNEGQAVDGEEFESNDPSIGIATATTTTTACWQGGNDANPPNGHRSERRRSIDRSLEGVLDTTADPREPPLEEWIPIVVSATHSNNTNSNNNSRSKPQEDTVNDTSHLLHHHVKVHEAQTYTVDPKQQQQQQQQHGLEEGVTTTTTKREPAERGNVVQIDASHPRRHHSTTTTTTDDDSASTSSSSSSPSFPTPSNITPTTTKQTNSSTTATNTPTVTTIATNTSTSTTKLTFLMRRGNAQEAYCLLDSATAILRNEFHQVWGHMLIGTIYKRAGIMNTFQAPANREELATRYVDVRIYNRSAIQDYLRQGGVENPYKEIARLRQLGDDVHVLRLVDALQDEHFLYIITRRAIRTLYDMIPWEDAMFQPPHQPPHPIRHTTTLPPPPSAPMVYLARNTYRKLIQIIRYLQGHGIAHRNIHPRNLVFLDSDTMVLCNFYYSHQLPTIPTTKMTTTAAAPHHNNSHRNPHPQTIRRVLTLPPTDGPFAAVTLAAMDPTCPRDMAVITRLAYLPPEVYAGRVCDGIQCDVWAATVILYNILTRRILYQRPEPNNILYRFNILARGLAHQPFNPLSMEVLEDLILRGAEGRKISDQLVIRAQLHRNLPWDAMTILEHVLVPSPPQRWTLEQIGEFPYVQPPPAALLPLNLQQQSTSLSFVHI